MSLSLRTLHEKLRLDSENQVLRCHICCFNRDLQSQVQYGGNDSLPSGIYARDEGGGGRRNRNLLSEIGASLLITATFLHGYILCFQFGYQR